MIQHREKIRSTRKRDRKRRTRLPARRRFQFETLEQRNLLSATALVAPYSGPFDATRIPLEVQSWWVPDFGHVHALATLPIGQTVSGTLDFDVRITMHNNPSHLTALRIDSDRDIELTVPLDEYCDYDGTEPHTCTFNVPVSLDTTEMDEGWREFRIRAETETIDGNGFHTSSAIPIYIDNSDEPDRNSTRATDTSFIGRGWYEVFEYSNAYWEEIPNQVVSGQLDLRVKGQAGGTEQLIVALDADHGTPAVGPWPETPPTPGTILLDTTTDVTQWHDISIDTTTLENGWHALAARGVGEGAPSDCEFCSGENTSEGVAKFWFWVDNAPTIASVTPGSGAVGTEVTVIGNGFTDATSVSFNGTAATSFTVDSDTQVRANVPAAATSGPITVTSSSGSATSPNDFTVTGPLPAGTFNPIEDAHSRSTSPSSNYGAVDHIRVRGGSTTYNSYLKFDVSDVDGPVASAKVRLYVVDASNDGGMIYSVSNNYQGTATPWVESGLTWNNAPAISGTAWDSAGAVSEGEWVEFDVTGSISGDGIYSFALTGNSTNSVMYSSTEGSNRPQLVIETAPGTLPQVSSFSPTSGPVGTEVTVTGDNFIGVTEVTFNGVAATSFTIDSDTQLRAEVPTGAVSGKIAVTNADGTATSANDFTVTGPLPSGTFNPIEDAHSRSTSPSSNYGNVDHIRVRGGSTTYNSYLKFDVSDLDGAVASAKVRLYVVDASNDGGMIYSVSNNYQGTATPWVESGLTWNNAPAISGTALDSAGAVSAGEWVEFDVTGSLAGDGIYSFALSSSSTNSVMYSSTEGSNLPQLVIETTSGTLPQISSFTPTSGPVGTEVTVTGNDFIGVTEVTFNGVAATSFIVDSDAQLRAVVPAGAVSGKIAITNASGTVTSTNDFTVTGPLPAGTFNPIEDAHSRSTSPSSNYGDVDHIRVRSGSTTYNSYLKFDVSGLDGSVENAKVRLYVVDASNDGGMIYSVSNNYQGTSTAWVESGLTWNNAPAIGGTALDSAGAVSEGEWVEFDVTGSISGDGIYSFALAGNSTNSVMYSSTEGSNLPELVIETTPGSLPQISSFSPTSGPVGTEVTVTGDNFIGVTEVTFNGVAATNVTIDSDVQLRAEVPAGAVSGQIGVTNADGTAISVGTFTVVDAPSIATFNPIDDAHGKSTSPSNNYGDADHIRIRSGSTTYNSYVKFDVSDLGGPVESAKVRLYVVDGSNDGGMIYSVANDYQGTATPWVESGLTWNNAPAISGTALDSAGAVSEGEWVEFDVTGSISGDGIYSFALTGNSTNSVMYSSTEGSNVPELVIETAPASSLIVQSTESPQAVAEQLDNSQLAPIVDEAIARFSPAVGSRDQNLLAGVAFEIVDLPGNLLGRTFAGVIQIDVDAAGYGWFVDPTPADDFEFTYDRKAQQLVADPRSPAAGKIDLLTAVMHEFGHILGHEHSDSGDLMNPALPLGTRRSLAADAATWQDHPEEARFSDNDLFKLFDEIFGGNELDKFFNRLGM